MKTVGATTAEKKTITPLQIETRIKELDLKASNIHREKASQNQVWDEEVNKLEMESERLKEIVLQAKKNP